MGQRFNAPPGWPAPPTRDWRPPADWSPDPSWPAAPPGWSFYVDDEGPAGTGSDVALRGSSAEAPAVVVLAPKSVGAAAVLTFFFGPLGMLYSTVLGAVVMFAVEVVVAMLTFGVGLVVTWPVCVVWAAVAASKHNERMVAASLRRS
jgi:hypothetical protein